jgi:hypothetical protein
LSKRRMPDSLSLPRPHVWREDLESRHFLDVLERGSPLAHLDSRRRAGRNPYCLACLLFPQTLRRDRSHASEFEARSELIRGMGPPVNVRRRHIPMRAHVRASLPIYAMPPPSHHAHPLPGCIHHLAYLCPSPCGQTFRPTAFDQFYPSWTTTLKHYCT